MNWQASFSMGPPESEATTNMGEQRNDRRRWFQLPKDNIPARKPDSFDHNERGSAT
jgi:hypothetical protein